ncbi:eCIS core domain-containing protein [Allocoleopsis sp.]|uniref:eCIS core domain-containing protein n=1 Tax=Allocoleopsis sp. TaxID=3088169 RepID=UPI002FD37708
MVRLMGNQRSLPTKTTIADRPRGLAITPKPLSSTRTPVHPLLQLQRQIGNQAVSRLIQTKLKVGKPNDVYEQEADRTADTVMRMPDPLVQRQVEEKKEETAQAKSSVGQISPLLQRQAEEKKEETAQTKSQIGPITPLVQRQAAEEKKDEHAQMLQRQAADEKKDEHAQMLQRQAADEKKDETAQAKGTADATPEVAPNLESRIQTMRGGGQPLADSTRTFFESRFGYDFGGVRVHTDSQAAETTSHLNAQAFTIGRNIFFNAGRYEPHTNSGKWLLAHELTHTLQQNPTQPLTAKRKIVQPQSEGGKGHPALRLKKNGAMSSTTPSGNAISQNSNPTIQRKAGGTKAPASPAQDAAFQAVVKKAKAAAKQQKHHPPAKSKATEAQAAAVPPANDVASKAAGKQVQQMDQQQPQAFNRNAFKAALLAKIAASAPKNLEEAGKFKESGKVGAIKGELTGQVDTSKKQSQGAVEAKVKGTPDPSGIEPKSVAPLPPNQAGAPPAGIDAAQAAPKPKTNAEVSLQEGSQSLDKQMTDAEVTDDQLKKSNEPDFQSAADAKQQVQKDAVTAPQEYRQSEQAVLTQAKSQAVTTAQTQLTGMHTIRGQAQNKTTTAQQQAKSQDEQKRTEVANELQTIYTQTKKAAEDRLARLDTEVNQAFDQGATAAQQAFEDYVQQRMDAYKDDRYSGIIGRGRWLKDKFLGMPSEVNAFYEEGRRLYIAQMDAVLDRVAMLVEKGLNEAKTEIAKGRKAIQTKLEQQPANLQKALQQDAAALQSQFDQLEKSVEDKQNQLINSLAQKYNEKLQAIDSRIEEMKAANRGLVDKALDAVVGVIKTILKLKDMLLDVLSRAASAIGKIIKHPIKFLGNLVSGLKQGFMNFVGNIGTHLEKGLMGWLFGAIAEAGIQLPESFDLKGILSLILQVLGATWAFIRARAVKILGEKVVQAMETTAEIFKILISEGIMGVWEYIKEQLSNLKDVVIEGIKSFVTDSIINAGVTWILGLLNPAGAFIKACKAIYDIIMFFVERGSQIMALVNAVIDSVSAIADGATGVAAKFVEDALGKAVPVVISFLAALLGVTGISKKIREVIEKVQAPVGKAIDWLINKAYNLVKATGKLLGFGKDKKDEKADPEHDKKVQVGLAAIDQEEQKYLQNGKLEKENAEKVAASVQSKHPVFKSIKIVDGNDSWDYSYVASPEQKKKGTKKAGVDLSELSGWRPRWRKGTDRELQKRQPEYYYKGTLNLKKGVDRRHKVAFEVIFKQLKAQVEDKPYEEAAKSLPSKYQPSQAKRGQIISACRSYLRDHFNDPENIWIGNSEENQQKGREMGHKLQELAKRQEELRNLLRSIKGKPENIIKELRKQIKAKNNEIKSIVDKLDQLRLDLPETGEMEAPAKYLAMLKAQYQRDLAEAR